MTLSQKLKVGVVSSNKGFCYFYRHKWPMEELLKQGLIEYERVNPHHGLEEIGELADWADIIIFQFAAPAENVISFQKYITEEKMPKVVATEFDDNFLQIHPSNAAYRVYGTEEVRLKDGTCVWKDKTAQPGRGEDQLFDIEENKKRIELMKQAVEYSDFVTVTQDHLRDAYLPYNDAVFSLGNYINPDMMVKSKRRDDKVYIVWQGGDSHHHDLRSILPALKTIKERYGDKIGFRFFGVSFFQMLDEIDAEVFPWVQPNNFYKMFADNMAHIGLIPLLDSEFNRCKSNIKYLEYSHYGLPSVVSNVTPYKEHITDNANGLLYNNNSELVSKLSKLIDDPILRINIGSAAKKKVDTYYTIQTHAHEWYDLYKQALHAKIEAYKHIK